MDFQICIDSLVDSFKLRFSPLTIGRRILVFGHNCLFGRKCTQHNNRAMPKRMEVE